MRKHRIYMTWLVLISSEQDAPRVIGDRFVRFSIATKSTWYIVRSKQSHKFWCIRPTAFRHKIYSIGLRRAVSHERRYGLTLMFDENVNDMFYIQCEQET